MFSDIWCALTNRCSVKVQKDQFLQWIDHQERESERAIRSIQAGDYHAIVKAYRHQNRGGR